ncbi:MAG: hypothetical protein HKN45_04655, partial [Flavobacteriales bacterium]|nr:hypothetical protein [Flavobacteriales bacterium]
MRTILLLAFSTVYLYCYSQKDSSQFKFEGDFRFRIEEDWNSRKSDGTMRDDRTRLRYRVRSGVTYEHDERISVGLRLRTGFFQKQQDPQLTLGDGFKEFGTLPFGLEKAYFQFEQNGYSFWLGKNSFPFAKQNELFWSDNVYPEGIAAKKSFGSESSSNSIDLIAAHFVINARGS